MQKDRIAIVLCLILALASCSHVRTLPALSLEELEEDLIIIKSSLIVIYNSPEKIYFSNPSDPKFVPSEIQKKLIEQREIKKKKIVVKLKAPNHLPTYIEFDCATGSVRNSVGEMSDITFTIREINMYAFGIYSFKIENRVVNFAYFD